MMNTTTRLPDQHFSSARWFYHLLLGCLLLVLPSPAFAQRNVFNLAAPVSIKNGQFPLEFVYEIPTDSVKNIVYKNAIISPHTSWLQRPVFIIPTGGIDSLRSTAAFLPGYYLLVGVFQNQIRRSIIHKTALNITIEDVEQIKILTITDEQSIPQKDVKVTLKDKVIAYNEGVKGYVIRDFSNGDTVTIRRGREVAYYRCAITSNGNYERPKKRNKTNEEHKENRLYNGYLVTNKPKYMPHDTVKWKAYIQDPRDGNKPVREPLRVNFEAQYGNGESYLLSNKFRYAEPGVYFGEFVLGDSVITDRIYELKLYGTHTACRINQQFKVEDYLLDEMKLRVTGEAVTRYQHGDSVNLYAYAYTSNNLPVLDGQVSITVVPGNFSQETKALLFIPDTLYRATLPVSPDGETNLSFSTNNFPVQLKDFSCIISVTNSNFEHKDTFINLSFIAGSRYLSVSQTGNKLRAVLISNKKEVAGKGLFFASKDYNNKPGKPVTYPFEYTIQANDVYALFQLTDDTGKVLTSYQHTIEEAGITGVEDFNGDTATLQLYNPSKVLLKYSIYRGNDFEGFGFTDADTLLKIYSPKGKTVTVIGAYTWRGQSKTARFTIYKMDRGLNIKLTKKDFIFPGQRDTISVHLADKEGRGIGKTNVTVLAFNSQFAEDYTPELPYGGLLYPGYTPRKNHSIRQLDAANPGTLLADSIWLSRCGADTAFFYKNLYLLPDDIAWVNYSIPKSIMPQLGIYLQKGRNYYQPEVLDVDNRPAYIKAVNSTNPNGIFMSEGRHNIRIRMAGMEYYLYGLDICAGTKTDLYLNVDSIGPFIWKDTVRDSIITYSRTNHLSKFINRTALPDSLTNSERDAIASSVLMYRTEELQNNEYNWRRVGFTPLFFQYPRYLSALKPVGQTDGYNGYNNYNRYNAPNTYHSNLYLLGPIDFADSAGFYQDANTKLRFVPEQGYIFTFRPQMTRVEKQSVYTYLNYKLRDNNLWPPDSFVPPNPPLYDTLQVTMPHRGPYLSSYSRAAVPVSERIQYSLVNTYARLDAHAPMAKFILASPIDSNLSYIIIRLANDTAPAYIISNNYAVNLKPGKYEVMIIWRNKHYSVYEGINVAANGTTVLPVSYKTERGIYDLKKPDSWLKRSVKNDTLSNYQFAFYSQEIAPNGVSGIAGTVTDKVGKAIIGAAVQVLLRGIVKDSTVTDKDGHFRFGDLAPGFYELVTTIGDARHTITGVPVIAGHVVRINNRSPFPGNKSMNDFILTAKSYEKPLIDFKSQSYSTKTAEDLEHLPSVNISDAASLSVQGYQSQNRNALNIAGGRTSNTTYIVDGVMLSAGNASFQKNKEAEDEEVSEKKGKFYLGSQKSQSFLNNFVANMMGASGVRKSFRDWAIWEPNLWTNKEGTSTFQVTYPDNMTSWKTYVLAMNRKGYSGKILQLTRAFKPLSAQLSAPRFLRFGDTVEAIGKVANYTKQPFRLRSSFRQDSMTTTNDTLTVHNTKVDILQVAAPAANVIDTAALTLAYSITTDNGYTDGEEKTIPVYPVGVTESKGIFTMLTGDSTIASRPDTAAGYFTGTSRIYVDGSLLETMLREIEQLKVYPHGCNEQLTTMLLSIYYEETIKRMLGNEKFNNTIAKRKILEKLVQAQRTDGSYGWWGNNDADYRITNYIIGTMQKINTDGWLDFIIRRGLGNLSSNLDAMNIENKIASLTTLSEGNYAANYKPVLDRIDVKKQSIYNRLAMVKIRKEQGLSYRAELDSLMVLKQENMSGTHFGYNGGYDWYRDDLAATLIAYKLVKGDSVYDKLTASMLHYILFKRQGGYYANTASSGLVLTTILPELMRQQPVTSSKATYLKINGSIKDSVTKFPKMYAVKNAQQQFTFEKKGISPVFVSVVYDYFNNHPVPKDSDFSVHTYFLNAGNDTVTSLKAGEKITLRTTVRCKKTAEYVMIEVPIPAGCVQADKTNRNYRYSEAARENFKDQTDIFCNQLHQDQTYTFDVVLEARYKGHFNISPAKAGMMYYPEEYGNTAVKDIRVR